LAEIIKKEINIKRVRDMAKIVLLINDGLLLLAMVPLNNLVTRYASPIFRAIIKSANKTSAPIYFSF